MAERVNRERELQLLVKDFFAKLRREALSYKSHDLPEQEPVNFDLDRMKLAVESPVSDVTVEGLTAKVKSNREHIADVKNMVEPVAWMYEWYENDLESTQVTGGSEKPFEGESTQPFNIRPLYTAPPKREQKPLTRQQISVGNQSMLNVTRDAFVMGVKFAEKMHGITGV